LLAAQATLACRWALERWHNLSELLDIVVGIWAPLACLTLVVVPSAAWSVVLAATAPLVGGGAGRDEPPRPRKRAVLGCVLLLPLAGLLGGLALSHVAGPGAHDMAGLEGRWREPVNPRHSYHFRPDGNLESAWSGLSHGVIGTWGRDGQRIKIRHNRDWQHVDDLDGTLQGEAIQWQATDRRTGERYDKVWKRDAAGQP
jgi:hypothetical protein